ncbi:MAG: hypothetical protein M3O85_05475 [Acidobacteriota bacterium]|nr:hypothetical protein [Acidobacteriota bacterium]
MAPPQRPRKLSRAKQYAQIERISIGGAVERMGPAGLWVYANAYAKAGLALLAPGAPYEPVRYYLACHSIELSLKAFLSLHGATMLELSENAFGHNLKKILKAAEAKGLQTQVALTQEHRVEIRKAATYYAGKVFEYPAVGEALVGYPRLPKLELLFAAAEVLVDTLEQPCRES